MSMRRICLWPVRNNEECSIIAVSNGEGNVLGSKSYLQKYVIPYIWIFAACILVVIVLVNACCSRWINSLLIPPMKEIRQGMQKVKRDVLDGEIPVLRQDELGEVCEEFNEMQRQLKRSKEEQLKYETYRKELLSSISHDLRTPLTTIKGYVGGILDGIADTEEKQKKYLLAVQTKTKDLENLVNQLSYYNKMENHIFQYHKEKTDLKDFVERYMEENETFLRENNLDILLSAPVGVTLEIDRGAFKRILDNLLTNSVRYRNTDKSRVEIVIQRKEGRIFWSVADDGPGVAKDCMEKIFESFCRLDEARSHCSEGSGLGLAIVRQIVTDHQGIIYARDKVGLEICMEFPNR